MKQKIVATNTRYPKDIHDTLVRLAELHERSFNAEVIWALRQYIEREEEKRGSYIAGDTNCISVTAEKERR